MKRVLFFISVVLLVLFKPTQSYGLRDIPTKDFEILKLKQLYTPNHDNSENFYLDAFILEEKDDGSTFEKGKFSSDETAALITFFIVSNFNDNSFRRARFPNLFLNFSQHPLIYFRVLRL
jgi:hypothetical protein